MKQIHTNIIWRAHVPAADSDHPELTLFVEANDYESAAERMVAICRQLRGLAFAPADQLFCNLRCGRDLIDTGASALEILRLFEKGWSSTGVISWVEQPVFVVSHPGVLINAWVRRSAGKR